MRAPAERRAACPASEARSTGMGCGSASSEARPRPTARRPRSPLRAAATGARVARRSCSSSRAGSRRDDTTATRPSRWRSRSGSWLGSLSGRSGAASVRGRSRRRRRPRGRHCGGGGQRSATGSVRSPSVVHRRTGGAAHDGHWRLLEAARCRDGHCGALVGDGEPTTLDRRHARSLVAPSGSTRHLTFSSSRRSPRVQRPSRAS